MNVGGISRLPYCCGVTDVGNFGSRQHRLVRSGTGLFTATFINNMACQRAYEQMKREHTLLFQSEPRMNHNSGHRVFLCVFQFRENVGNVPQL